MAISPWLLLHIPTAILGLLMVGLSAVLPMTGLLVVRRRGPLMPLGSDNEVARSPRFEPSETPRVGRRSAVDRGEEEAIGCDFQTNMVRGIVRGRGRTRGYCFPTRPRERARPSWRVPGPFLAV